MKQPKQKQVENPHGELANHLKTQPNHGELANPLETWQSLMEAIKEEQRLPVRRPGCADFPGLWIVYDHLFVCAQLLPLEGQQHILHLPTRL
jgi:hypothetical protein